MRETRRTSTLVFPCMIYSACFSKGSYICSIMYKGNRFPDTNVHSSIPLQAFCFSIMLCHLPSVCRNVNKVAWKTSQQDTDAETRTQVSFAALFRSALCASGWADETIHVLQRHNTHSPSVQHTTLNHQQIITRSHITRLVCIYIQHPVHYIMSANYCTHIYLFICMPLQ